MSRAPHAVYALRIGKVRDGSKPGVLVYAQEHGNEWVPPLVTIETAERLLRNHGVDIGRNFDTGSVFDGFTGASTACTSDTFAGPMERSEPESRNLDWIAQTHPNIHYAINLQSPGYQYGIPAWTLGAGTETQPPFVNPDSCSCR